MENKKKKRLVLIGIRRKGEKGFLTKIKDASFEIDHFLPVADSPELRFNQTEAGSRN